MTRSHLPCVCGGSEVEPVLFGAQQNLYGVYSASTAAMQRGKALLMCYPAGHEYMRIHRPYSWLASMLAKQGIASFRFDYSNTGDSTGSFSQARLAHWVADAEHALDYLKRTANVEQVAVLGVRIGAIVALELSQRAGLEELVLWEPRARGDDYIEEMRQTIKTSPFTRANFVEADGTLHFNGYGYSPAFQHDLKNWRVPRQLPSLSKVLLLASEIANLTALTDAMGLADTGVDTQQVEGIGEWHIVDAVGGLFLPQNVLRVIAEWLGARAAVEV